jgi:hypothetical protein
LVKVSSDIGLQTIKKGNPLVKAWQVPYMRVVDHLETWGHPNITARNRTTFEFTKESQLTSRGDCIVGVRANKSAIDLAPEFKALARSPSAVIRIEMTVDAMRVAVVGRGSPALSLSHPTDLVGRRSNYICGRTLMVRADRAARDFPRELVEAMRNPLQRARVAFTVEV